MEARPQQGGMQRYSLDHCMFQSVKMNLNMFQLIVVFLISPLITLISPLFAIMVQWKAHY